MCGSTARCVVMDAIPCDWPHASSLLMLTTRCFPPQKERNNDNSFAHVYQFIELGPPSATGVKRAESVLAGTFDFAGEIGSLPDGGPTPLHHALWACSMSLAAKYELCRGCVPVMAWGVYGCGHGLTGCWHCIRQGQGG